MVMQQLVGDDFPSDVEVQTLLDMSDSVRNKTWGFTGTRSTSRPR